MVAKVLLSLQNNSPTKFYISTAAFYSFKLGFGLFNDD